MRTKLKRGEKMILIGHPWIESTKFCRAYTEEEIDNIPENQTVLLEPLVDSHNLARYCHDNDIPYAVVINSLDEAIYANALGARYVICDEDTALMVQPVANEYLFDTRILVLIKSEKEVSKIARSGIDGVVFGSAIC
jgi:hypothetical protein